MTTYDEYGIPVGAYSEPEGLTHQAWRLLRAVFLYRIRPTLQEKQGALRRSNWSVKSLFTLANALIVCWWVVLYWGERAVFNSAVNSCDWDRWEKWNSGANPHRLIFVADPQLIDPHTYPGRPWPLNPLTYKYTDVYLRRTYSRFQTILHPDTIFFLGDLFDGGREWSTRTTVSPEERYRKYGNDFWMNEYRRFGDVFFKHWSDGGMQARPGQPDRKIIASLPGNHDLGFGQGVQEAVRDRFSAYFGDGNRIDVIANHTFVSIDSVSLSARASPQQQELERIWRPTMDFLENAKKQKRRLIQRELRIQQGLKPYPGFAHKHIELEDLAKSTLPHADDDVTEFPTILLTHVPLYRAPGTPCGPLREHWPPTPPPPNKPALERDDRNAISVSRGYQYQNVINLDVTVDIAEKIGDIRYAFSGDDHDYCEVRHMGYASGGGGIREITVKSISWAMGVRHPGVVLMSMWNPVDQHGRPKSGDASKTIQTHLCLMPDQIGTFLTYALLFGFTFTLLLIRAVLIMLGVLAQSSPPSDENPLLPTTNTYNSSAENEKAVLDHSHSSNSSTSSERGNLLGRTAQSRGTARTSSPASSTYTYPLVQHAGYFPGADEGEEDKVAAKKMKIYGSNASTRPMKKREGWSLCVYELRRSLWRVVGWGLVWYVWLVWRG